MVGPLFEVETRTVMWQILPLVCHWARSVSPITTRILEGGDATSRQADIMGYLTGESLLPCSPLASSGVAVLTQVSAGGGAAAAAVVASAAVPLASNSAEAAAAAMIGLYAAQELRRRPAAAAAPRTPARRDEAAPRAAAAAAPSAAAVPSFVAPLAAMALPNHTRFSPADPKRSGPGEFKYFFGEAYSGANNALRKAKVVQLETLLSFVQRRWADQHKLVIDDVTRIVGAAALVFCACDKNMGAPVPRDIVMKNATSLVRDAVWGAGGVAMPNLRRLASAHRLLLVVLAPDQCAATSSNRAVCEVIVEQQQALSYITTLLEKLMIKYDSPTACQAHLWPTARELEH